jgi:hypothetical protein
VSPLGPHPLLLLSGFLAIGTASAAIYARSSRPGLGPRRRRILGLLWIVVLLAGGPLWMVVAAGIGLL